MNFKTPLCLVLMGFLAFSSCSKKDNSGTTYKGTDANRSTASTENKSDTQIMEEINNSIVSIQQKSEINPKIDHVVEMAAEAGNEKKLILQTYAALLGPVKTLEGIVWRMRGVVEKSGILHLNAVDTIKTIYYRGYMVGDHIKAIVRYMVEPKMDSKEFESVGEIQDYFFQVVSKEIEKSLKKIQFVIANASPDFNFEFDGHLISGKHSERNKSGTVTSVTKLVSEKNRFYKVIKPHYYYAESMLERVLGTIDYAVIYNAEAATTFINKMLRKTALNQIGTKRPHFMTPREALEVLSTKQIFTDKRFKKKYRPFLKKRDRFNVSQVEKILDKSFHHFYRATKAELKAYNETIAESDHSKGNTYVVNPNWLKLRTEKTRQRLSERITLYEYGMKGKSIGHTSPVTGKPIAEGESYPITSDVTGDQVKVNLKALFRYREDLKFYLPNEFKGTKRGEYIRRTDEKAAKRHGKKVWAWHYTYGKPLSWPDPTFGGFLPENSNETIFTTMRILKQTTSIAPYVTYLPVP